MKTFVIEVPVELPVTGHARPKQQAKMTTFEEYRHRKALALQTSIARKYIGPPDDPHFIPSSPILSRQNLSLAEEQELRTSCASVLAQIPHSDETHELCDKDLTIQVAPKKKKFSREKRSEKKETVEKPEKPEKPRKDWKEWRREKRAAEAAAATVVAPVETKEEEPVSQPRSILSDDSATPSDLSNRETMVTCKSSPWTTPAFTPGDVTCPMTESARPSTANPGSNLKTELKSLREESSNNKVMSFLNDMGSIYSSKVTPAARSMTYLPISDKDKPQSKTKSKSRSKEKQEISPKRKRSSNKRNPPIVKPNTNKSLPHIPPPRQRTEPTIRLVDAPSNNEDRHFVPRRLKTANRARTEPEPEIVMESRSCSTDPHEALSYIMSEPIHPYESHLSPSPRKKPFDFTSFFQRRKQMEAREMMVTAAA